MKISQDAFADAITSHFVPLESEGTLAKAGVNARTLSTIVGADGVLDRAEAEALHTRLARSPKGDVAAAKVMDGVDAENKLQAELHPPWKEPEPPRTPSVEARATFRHDAARMATALKALRERTVPEHHDRLATTLKRSDMVYKSIELLEVGQATFVPHLVGLSASVTAPILGTVVALAKIGQANEAGRIEGDRQHVIDAYAAGVAAALDPSEAVPRPTEPETQALYDQGFFEANALTPTEQRDLEDRLVLMAEQQSRTGSTRYAAPTYAHALARLVGMGHWDPAAR